MSDIICIDDEDDGSEFITPKKSTKDDRVPLLPFEQNLMLDTFVEDVLFITGRGLCIERLFLNHLHLYSDPDFTVLVLNTTDDDAYYFLERLKRLNRQCPPKILSSEVLSKDRELIYKTGGVQFITSRILMVDLLTDRVPLEKISGIVVYNAHQILSGFQESFILRLFREKRKNGFVKAFTDHPTKIVYAGLGQLQRLMDKLYIRRVVVVPRFDAGVKEVFDLNPPKFTQISLELPQNQRKIRIALAEIMNTCSKELKQCTHGLELDSNSNIPSPSSTIKETKLEQDLRQKTLLLSERQERILADLQILRILLHKVEDLDPTNAYNYISRIRADKNVLDKNSGWLFTPTATAVFSGIESLCSAKDENGIPTISSPPKWAGLIGVLEELVAKLLDRNSDTPVLVLASNEQTCRQLIDLVKFGLHKFSWMLAKSAGFFRRRETMGPEPPNKPVWNPVNVALYDSQLLEKHRTDLLNQVKELQKKAGRDSKKRGGRRLLEQSNSKQPKLVNFGIVRYAEKLKEKKETRSKKFELINDKEMIPEGMLPEDPLTDHYAEEIEQQDSGIVQSLDEEFSLDSVKTEIIEASTSKAFDVTNLNSTLVFLKLTDRYNLLNCLENLKPSHIVLYNVDIVATRLIETFKANHKEHPLELFALIYTDTTEEERYLLGLRNEQEAFEILIREQGVLVAPTEYEVSRENCSQLRRFTLKSDSRNAMEPEEDDFQPRVIVDMREFNSELPTVLYKRGVELEPATLEVGDYILSPDICVERKALDDLAQSLNNGRVFKQIEQMLRHYSNSILLIESSEKFRQRKVNGGPFQGELSRRGRETRSLFTMLIRANPKMNVLWSFSPAHSAELFEEIKLDQPNPNIEVATAIRSDDLGITESQNDLNGDKSSAEVDSNRGEDTGNEVSKSNLLNKRLNSVMKRQLSHLPGMLSGDVERLIRNGESENLSNPGLLAQASVEQLTKVLTNAKQAEAIYNFLQTDFRQQLI